jgi:hypothetical protein
VVTLIAYYDAGDAERLVGLVDGGFWSNNQSRNAYADFFRATKSRHLRLERLAWNATDGTLRARGEATVQAEYFDRAPFERRVGRRDGHRDARGQGAPHTPPAFSGRAMSVAARRAAIVVFALALVWRVLHVNAVLYDDNGRPRLPAVARIPPRMRMWIARRCARRSARIPDRSTHCSCLRAGTRARATRSRRAALSMRPYQLAPDERNVLAAVAEFQLRQGDVARALPLLDRLVDTYPEMRPGAFEILGQLLSEGREPATWKRILARKPTWLGLFIVSSCERGMDPAILVPLLLERTPSSRSPTPESACVIDRLRVSDRWQQAYQVWLNTLPRETLVRSGVRVQRLFRIRTERPGLRLAPDSSPWRGIRGIRSKCRRRRA